MGRAPCCAKVGLHRGPWAPREDTLLVNYIQSHGEGNWRSLPKKAGLLRCGKSCRLRWMNYLRPDIKRGNITPDEEDLIVRIHSLLGNRWSLIAGRLPGRTDNEIKNHWNTHLSKRLLSQGTDPNTHIKLPEPVEPNRKKRSKKQKLKRPVQTTEKPPIHLPKPVRVRSFSFPANQSSIFECNNTLVSSCNVSNSVEGAGSGTEGGARVLCNWSDQDENRIALLGACDDMDDDPVNGSDFECQSHLPAGSDGSLEKLYEEYLELLETNDDQLELDSFAESFLL